MSTNDQQREAFEQRARERLAESTDRLDGRIRSRLTQARFAAVEEARRAHRSFTWRNWIPAGALAAAAVLAVALWNGNTSVPQPPTVTAQNSLDDLEIVAGDESFELLEDLEFYEWVATVDNASIG